MIGGGAVYAAAPAARRPPRGHRRRHVARRRRHPGARHRRRAGAPASRTPATAGTCRRAAGSRYRCRDLPARPEPGSAGRHGVRHVPARPHDRRPAPAPVRARAHRDGHAVHARTAALDLAGAAAAGRPTWSTTAHDGLVVSGTTGESPTTSDAEKDARCSAPSSRRSATGPRSSPGSAPTTPRTRSSWPARPRRPARTACWSSRRTTTSRRRTALVRALHGGRRRHRAAGDALRHPGPHRHADRDRDAASGWPSTPRIVAVKDAKGDLFARSPGDGRDRPRLLLRRRRAQPALARASAPSASSASSATSPAAGYARVVAAVDAGDLAEARAIHRAPAARRCARS